MASNSLVVFLCILCSLWPIVGEHRHCQVHTNDQEAKQSPVHIIGPLWGKSTLQVDLPHRGPVMGCFDEYFVILNNQLNEDRLAGVRYFNIHNIVIIIVIISWCDTGTHSGDIYLNQEVNYTVFTVNNSLSTHLIASMFSFIAHEPQLSVMTPTHIWHRILVYLT